MIQQYVDQALRRARYDKLDNNTYVAEIVGLQGVIGTGDSIESCRDELVEVIEEWVLVRISQGLPVPEIRSR